MKAIELAKYIIEKCNEENKSISNLQLQKILFYIQERCLVNGKPAFPERIEAWQFGVVVPKVYKEFCHFGAMPIDLRFSNIELEDDCKDNKNVIDKIIEYKRELELWDLVKEIHKKGGAWDTVYDNGKGQGKVIPINLIKEKANNNIN